MPALTRESTVVRSQEMMASPLEKELVMIHLERGNYYSLDEIGADIWNRLATPVRVTDLCDQLVLEYAIDRETCEQDVLALLNEMAAEDLLHSV